VRPSNGDKRYYPHLAYNGIIAGLWNNRAASKLADINGASSKILMTHNKLWPYFSVKADDLYSWATTSDLTSSNQDLSTRVKPIWVHNDGQVFLFTDGHSKWASRAKTAYYTCNGNTTLDNTATTGCGFWIPKVEPPT